MSNFAPVDEQLAYLTKGRGRNHSRGRTQGQARALGKTGKPLRVKAGFDPTAPDIHLGHTGADPQAQTFSGSRPHGDFPDWRFHRDDRRSFRAQRDAPSVDAGADCRERGNLQGAGLQDSRPGKNRGGLQQPLARKFIGAGLDQALLQVHGGADAGARRLSTSAP